jgi:hypothetical protein
LSDSSIINEDANTGAQVCELPNLLSDQQQ